MGLVVGKSVFGFSDQDMPEKAFPATEFNYKMEISLVALDGYIFAVLFETTSHYFCWLSWLVFTAVA